MTSARAVDWVLRDPSSPVQVGDQISAAAGGMPIYRVCALASDRIVLEDDLRHTPREVTNLSGLIWKAA